VLFDFYGEWLFLQPNGSNLYYAAEAFPFDASIAVPPVSPNWQIFEIDPSYSSGFEVGTNFIFPANDMNLEVNWERMHSQDSESMQVAPQSIGTGNMVGPIWDIGPNSANYKNARGIGFFHFDAVNLFAGKTVCFMNNLKTRFYAGAGFIRVKQQVSSEYFNSALTISRSVSASSLFLGAGPEFGLDFDYRLIRGFSFTGSTSAALYMGQLQNSTTFTSFTPRLNDIHVPQPNVQQTTVPNRAQLIPGFVEKLGFSYASSFNSSKWTLAAGYQFQIYVNAVQSMDFTSPQVPPSLSPAIVPDLGVYAVGFQRTLSNYILTGPYVSLAVDF
jgi:hypothetical protein